jgi:hypothetical protein
MHPFPARTAVENDPPRDAPVAAAGAPPPQPPPPPRGHDRSTAAAAAIATTMKNNLLSFRWQATIHYILRLTKNLLLFLGLLTLILDLISKVIFIIICGLDAKLF